jgi:hypothetical protein
LFEERFDDNEMLNTIEWLAYLQGICTEVPWIFFISPILCLTNFHLAAKTFITTDKIKPAHQDVQVIKQERLVSFHID